MAMIRVDPVDVQVRTDWFDGRPREITWRDERLPVTGVVAVRHEDAAYPVAVGPRTLFEITTRNARFALSFRHRSRRWTLEAVEDLEVQRAPRGDALSRIAAALDAEVPALS